MHPITAVLFLALHYCALLWEAVSRLHSKHYRAMGIIVVAALIPFGFLAALVHVLSNSGEHLPLLSRMDSTWISIIRMRSNPIFITAWTPASFATIGILVLTAICILSDGRLGRWQRQLLVAAIGIGVAGLLVSLVGVDVLKLAFLAQIQFIRFVMLMQLFVFVAAILFLFSVLGSDFLSRFAAFGIVAALSTQDVFAFTFLVPLIICRVTSSAWLRVRRPGIVSRTNVVYWSAYWLCFLIVAAPLCVTLAAHYRGASAFIFVNLAAIVFAVASDKASSDVFPSASAVVAAAAYVLVLQLPAAVVAGKLLPVALADSTQKEAAFMHMCTWIDSHTSEDALIATEPWSNSAFEVRYFCERSVFYDAKDGAQVVFDRTYALEWYRRYLLTAGFSSTKDGMQLGAELSREHIDYVIAESPIGGWGQRLLFASGTYRIYGVR